MTMPMTNTTAAPHLKTLRVALFSGNYNCVRDGANQALNRLVAHLESQGVEVRVFSPTIDKPAFEPAGRLISVPSVPFPLRGEYRLSAPLTPRTKAELEAFKPHLVHISAPDLLGWSAVNWAQEKGIPAIASIHTRFETYFTYYHLGWVEGRVRRYMRDLYNRCQQVLVPTQCMADILREEGITTSIRFWSRGVDHQLFNPGRRSLEWRRARGIADDDAVVAFVGRVVKEKGLQPFANTVRLLRDRGCPFQVLIVGDGPARHWFAKQMPEAIFTGSLSGVELATAFASSDIFLNPSVTETFGNVNLEAIASGVAVVGAQASGANSLIKDGVTGLLVPPNDGEAYADAVQMLIRNAERRHRMGHAGALASRSYEWTAILSQVAEHYLDTVHGYQPQRVLLPRRMPMLKALMKRAGSAQK